MDAVQARPPFRHRGSTGWLLTAGVVLAWDFTAPETMSESFRSAVTTPQGRAAAIITWAYLTAHLFEVIPRERDPLDIVHQAWARRRART